MGKKLGVVLVGLGVLLLTVGLLSKFYAYPNLAVVPPNQKSLSFSEADDATVFSIAERQEVTKDLLTTVNVIGDVKASKEISDKLGKKVVVWEKTTYTDTPDFNIDAGQPPLSASHDRIAFDANTGEAVQCCGTYTSGGADLDSGEEERESDVKFSGQIVKFPFNTQKKTYNYWDSTLQKAMPMAYKGTENLEGTTVYKFQTVIPETPNGSLDAPASIFGIAQPGDVTLDRTYSNTRTLMIEPETGAIVKSEEQPEVYASYQGERIVTLTQLSSAFPEKDVKKNAEEYGSNAGLLKIFRVWLPLVGIILGLLLIAGGLALAMMGDRRRRGDRAATTTTTTRADNRVVDGGGASSV